MKRRLAVGCHQPGVPTTPVELEAAGFAGDCRPQPWSPCFAAAAACADAAPPGTTADGGLLKSAVTGNAVCAVELALELSGNHGLSRHNPSERHYCDVPCSRIHTPQNDSILTAAGMAALET